MTCVETYFCFQMFVTQMSSDHIHPHIDLLHRWHTLPPQYVPLLCPHTPSNSSDLDSAALVCSTGRLTLIS